MMTGASLLTALAFDEPQATAAWMELLVLLGNRFPIIRKQTAEMIYEKLLFQEETPMMNELSQALLEAAWDGPLDDVVRHREKLSEILQIRVPTRKQKTPKKTDGVAKSKVTDENASYKTLVEDSARGM